MKSKLSSITLVSILFVLNLNLPLIQTESTNSKTETKGDIYKAMVAPKTYNIQNYTILDFEALKYASKI